MVGGAGHVGAPLSVVLARRGLRTLSYDIDAAAVARLDAGTMPFREEGGQEELRAALDAGMLEFTTDVSRVRGVPTVILTVGTPVDEFGDPVLGDIHSAIDDLLPHLADGQTIIVRSTVYPGTTEHLAEYLRDRGRRAHVAFCPERVVQGRAIQELPRLPQIIGGTTPEAEENAARLFARIASSVIRMSAREAEFAKLFSNAYRYIQFAAANQFYMMAESEGLDYTRLLAGMKADYPRMRDLPGPGLAAGPCLYKDTLQLAAFSDSGFPLGLAAIRVNEGLPAFLLERASRQFPLGSMTVGLLGMAFKANSDDTRASLSYKLRKLLRLRARDVLATDPFVTNDPSLLPVGEVIERSDLLILCVPHSSYSELDLRTKPVVDVWGFFDRAASTAQRPQTDDGRIRPEAEPRPAQRA